MEVCFARCRLGWVERVMVKCSQVTRGAYASRPFTLLLCCHRAAYSVGEPRAELCFDSRAFGAEAIRLQLGHRMADSADLFVDRSPIEEAQTCRGHCSPPGDGLEKVSGTPTLGDAIFNSDAVSPLSAKSAGYRPNGGPGRQAGQLTGQLDARGISSFRNPWLRNVVRRAERPARRANDDAA